MNLRGQASLSTGKLLGILLVLAVLVVVAFGAIGGFDRVRAFFEIAIPGFGMDGGVREGFNLVGYELIKDGVFYWNGVGWVDFGVEEVEVADRKIAGGALRVDFKKFYISRSGNVPVRGDVAQVIGYRFYSELRGLIFLENIEIAGFEFNYKGKKYLLAEDDKLYKFVDGKYRIETTESFPEVITWRDSIFGEPRRIADRFHCVRRSITTGGNYLVSDLSVEVAEGDSC